MVSKEQEYNSNTITFIQTSNEIYIVDNSWPSIIKNNEFQYPKYIVGARRQQPTGQCLGNKKRKADLFAAAELEIILLKICDEHVSYIIILFYFTQLSILFHS